MIQKEHGSLEKLTDLKKEGKINSFNAIGFWIPSEVVQQSNQELLRNLPHSVLKKYAGILGVNENILIHWQNSISDRKLNFDGIKSNTLLSELQLSDKERAVLVDLNDVKVLQTIENHEQGIYHIQLTEYLSQLFKDYRNKAQSQLGVALLLLLLLSMVYRLRTALKLIVPVVIPLLAAYASMIALGYSINLFSVMPAFSILGMGYRLCHFLLF